MFFVTRIEIKRWSNITWSFAGFDTPKRHRLLNQRKTYPNCYENTEFSSFGVLPKHDVSFETHPNKHQETMNAHFPLH